MSSIKICNKEQKEHQGIELIETREINAIMVNGYYGVKQAWFTRSQIGELLEYSNPLVAIAKIHKRHKDRLDLFSRVYQIDTPSGKQDAIVYNLRGVLEICRWSKQPKADMIMDALYDMAEDVMEKGYYSSFSDEELLDILSSRLKKDPHLINSVSWDKRNRNSYLNMFAEERVRELWKKRTELTMHEYNTELVKICNDKVSLYSKEWRRYMSWLNASYKANMQMKLIQGGV